MARKRIKCLKFVSLANSAELFATFPLKQKLSRVTTSSNRVSFRVLNPTTLPGLQGIWQTVPSSQKRRTSRDKVSVPAKTARFFGSWFGWWSDQRSLLLPWRLGVWTRWSRRFRVQQCISFFFWQFSRTLRVRSQKISACPLNFRLQRHFYGILLDVLSIVNNISFSIKTASDHHLLCTACIPN